MQTVELLFRVWRKDGQAVSRDEYESNLSSSLFGVPAEGFDEVGRAVTVTCCQISTEDHPEEDSWDSALVDFSRDMEQVAQSLKAVNASQIQALQGAGLTVDFFVNVTQESYDVLDVSLPSSLLFEMGRIGVPLAIFAEIT